MSPKIFLISLLISFTLSSIAQNDSTEKITLLDKGIMIDNIEVFIPWGLSSSDISKIGNPKIDTLKGKWSTILWRNVTFFDGLKGSLKYSYRIKKRKDRNKLFHLDGSIANSDFEKAVSYFNENLYSTPKEKKWNGKYFQYIWKNSKLLVQLIKGKNFTLIYIARSSKDIK